MLTFLSLRFMPAGLPCTEGGSESDCFVPAGPSGAPSHGLLLGFCLPRPGGSLAATALPAAPLEPVRQQLLRCPFVTEYLFSINIHGSHLIWGFVHGQRSTLGIRDREGEEQEAGSVAQNNCPSWMGKGQAMLPDRTEAWAVTAQVVTQRTQERSMRRQRWKHLCPQGQSAKFSEPQHSHLKKAGGTDFVE